MDRFRQVSAQYARFGQELDSYRPQYSAASAEDAFPRYDGAMRFTHFSAPLALVVLAVSALPGLAASRTLLENDKVRVIEAVDQPHSPSAPHQHNFNRVMVYLQPGNERITPEGAKPELLTWGAGEVKWSRAGGRHVSEITSNAPVTMIEIEIKKQGDPAKKVTTALDPVKIDSQDYRVEFENSQVRVVRVHMAPHRAVPLHEHQLDRVVVYLTDQRSRITSADGKAEMAEHKAGEASWGGPAKHREENLNGTPFEGIVVELKN